MIRLYLRWAALEFVLLTGVILLIRAQPYDDHELRALLMPEDCEMPCFMGIRPGITTVDEAASLLVKHPWVKEIVRTGGSLDWYWNGHEPAFLDGIGIPTVSAIVSDGRETVIVGSIFIPTQLPAGYIYLLMPNPTAFRAHPLTPATLSLTTTNLIYMDVSYGTFDVAASILCPSRLNNFWSTHVAINVLSKSSYDDYWMTWDRQKLRNIMYHDGGCS